MSPQIRKAVPADAGELLQLIHDCVAAMRAAGIDQWDEVYPNATSVENDIRSGALDMLTDEAGLAACITIDQTLDPLWRDMDWTPGSEPAFAVHRLMVHPSRQGRGYAKVLMAHAEDLVRGLGGCSIRLDSFLQNPAAMALYPKLGYRRTGTASMRKGAFAGFEKRLEPTGISIRAMKVDDIPAALHLWQQTEGIGLAPEETPAMLENYIERNPGISSAAVDERTGELLGALLGGDDGRRAFLYHLAVAKAHRKRGIGRRLVDRTLEALSMKGIVKAAIMVYGDNTEGRAFWEHLGWRMREDLRPMQVILK